MEGMTPRERILATFENETVDKVPIHHLGFSSDAASQILGREVFVGGGIQQWREAKALWQGDEAHREFLKRSLEDAFKMAKATDQDMLRLEYWRLPEKPSEKIDEYTFFYGNSEKWHVRRFLPDSELFNYVEEYPPRRKMTMTVRFREIEKYLSEREEWLENYRPRRGDFADIHRWMEIYGKEYAIIITEGAVGIGVSTEDPVWLISLVARPDLAARYLDIQVEIALRRMKYLAEAGVKILRAGVDIATNDGLCYPPRIFHELVLPRLRRVAEECHRNGMYYLFSSDGNLWQIADDLFGKGEVDGYMEVDRRAGMDLHKLKERFPDLVLIGNISSHTLHQGSKEDVIKETLSCLKDAKSSGGIIVGVSNYIVPGTPKKNIAAMIENIRKHR